jgi:deoxycytidine triphosphate deaminase
MVSLVSGIAPFNRLLNDAEIERAIREELIELDNPSVYLKERKTELIQPASMDLLLRDVDPESHTLLHKREPSLRKESKKHPNLDDNFVTFWPGTQRETSVMQLRGYNREVLFGIPELRSTLRRAGLDIGFHQLGIGFDEDCFGFINIRNAQEYPISIEKGTKIAQTLWLAKGIPVYERNLPVKFSAAKAGSGIPIYDRTQLHRIMDSGDLQVEGKKLRIHRDGFLVFHSGNVRTRNAHQHITLRKDGKHQGLETFQDISDIHHIQPGYFADIETEEKIKLSKRIGIRVFYPFNLRRDSTREDAIDSVMTQQSCGGWIDPGYGSKTQNGAVFSVQRKAFTKPTQIKEGQPVAFGLVYYFPKGVGLQYGEHRGSHYDGAKSFVASK